MKIRVFSIPALGDERACDELNAFLARQRVRDLDKRFVEAGASSYWSIAVTYVEGEDTQRPSQRSAAKAKIDDRTVRIPAESDVHAHLRAANRNANHPSNSNDNVGVRLARAHGPSVVSASDPTVSLSALLGARRRLVRRRRAGRDAERPRRLAGVFLMAAARGAACR